MKPDFKALGMLTGRSCSRQVEFIRREAGKDTSNDEHKKSQIPRSTTEFCLFLTAENSTWRISSRINLRSADLELYPHSAMTFVNAIQCSYCIRLRLVATVHVCLHYTCSFYCISLLILSRLCRFATVDSQVLSPHT